VSPQGSQHREVEISRQALQHRNPGSGTRRSMEQSARRDGLEDERFLARLGTESRRARPALCDNKIDGFYYGVGHPSATSRTDDHMRRQVIPLAGPVVDS